MTLSVCVPTISPRESLLSRLLFYLSSVPEDRAEVLIHQGDEVPMGEKIDRMFDLAQGSHVVVVNDDDWISERYWDLVLPLCEEADYVSYQSVVLVDDRFEEIHDHEIDGRGVSHKCPIKAELATKVPFPNHYTGDLDWAKDIQPLVSSSIHLAEPLYFYDYQTKHWTGTEAEGWQTQRHVGWWPHSPERFRWI